MARQLRRQSFSRQGQRRKTLWIGSEVSNTGFSSIPEGTAVLAQNFDTRLSTQLVNAPFTIVRLRGRLMINPDVLTAVEEPFGAIGACVVNGEAFDAGVASVITPYTEASDGRWFWHQYWSSQIFITSTGSTQLAFELNFDNKAMRKVDTGDVIIFVIENKSAVDAAIFRLNFRMLIKLH